MTKSTTTDAWESVLALETLKGPVHERPVAYLLRTFALPAKIFSERPSSINFAAESQAHMSIRMMKLETSLSLTIFLLWKSIRSDKARL